MTEKEFNELKPGDKVQIVKNRTAGMNSLGAMDKWLGKIMTVREHNGYDIRMKEDQNENYYSGWLWCKDMIKCKVPFEEIIINVLARGNKIIAKHDKKVGIAMRSPKDNLDEAKGVIIAVARLYGDDVVSDKMGKVTLASEERRRMEKVVKSAANTVKELRRMCLKNPSDAAIDKLAEGVFGKPLKETAKERVYKELAELDERTDKLSHALLPLADKIGTDTEAYNLLSRQLDVMRIYAEILKRRLAIWKD